MKFPSSITKTLLHLAEPDPPLEIEKLGNVLALDSKLGTILVAPVDETLDQDTLTEIFGECTLVRLSAILYRLERDGSLVESGY